MIKINKLLKIIKGVLFIVIGLLFVFVTFYNIKQGENLNEIMFYDFKNQQDMVIAKTIFNYIFSVLFVMVGVLEIKEAGDNDGN